jgi:hypothetical protein
MNVVGLWAPADAAWCLPPEGPDGTELQTRLRTHPEAREWRLDADRWRALAQAAQVDSRPEWTLSAKAVYSGPKAWIGMDLPGVRELTGEFGVRLGFSWREHRSASLRTQRMMRMSDRSDADLRMWELGFTDRWNEIHLEWTAACRELVTAHADLELAVSMERIELNRSDGGGTSRDRILDAMLTRMNTWMRTERIRLRIRRLNTAWSGLTLARPYMEEES